MTTAVTRDRGDCALDTAFLEGTLGFTIRLCQLNVFDDFIDRLSGLDLRPAEFSILCLIADNPGCRASRIAEYLWIKRPNFVPLLSGLEHRKLVVQRDRRQVSRSVSYGARPASRRQGEIRRRRARAVHGRSPRSKKTGRVAECAEHGRATRSPRGPRGPNGQGVTSWSARGSTSL